MRVAVAAGALVGYVGCVVGAAAATGPAAALWFLGIIVCSVTLAVLWVDWSEGGQGDRMEQARQRRADKEWDDWYATGGRVTAINDGFSPKNKNERKR